MNKPKVEIREYDGQIDEVVAENPSFVHLEDLGENGWHVRIDYPNGDYWMFTAPPGELVLFEANGEFKRVRK